MTNKTINIKNCNPATTWRLAKRKPSQGRSPPKLNSAQFHTKRKAAQTTLDE